MVFMARLHFYQLKNSKRIDDWMTHNIRFLEV